MWIEGYWIAFVDNGIITYYKGDLARAKRFEMRLCRPAVHVRRLETDSAFAVLCEERGKPVTRHTLYFWNLLNPQEASLETMQPGGLDVLL